MISPEKFQELEYKYGCGYWNVCCDHACPCAITVENKGLRDDIYDSLVKEMVNQYDDVLDYDDYFGSDDTFDYDDYYEDDEED